METNIKKQFEGYDISKDKFVLVQEKKQIQDVKLSTKPIGYFKDALLRFKKNKSSIAGVIIIAFMLIFAICVSIFSRYGVNEYDLKYAKTLPKLFSSGVGFWDGTSRENLNQSLYENYNAMNAEQTQEGVKGGAPAVVRTYGSELNDLENRTYYTFQLDSYAKVGYNFLDVTLDQYKAMQDYQKKNNIQLLYPIPNEELMPEIEKKNANYWYKTKTKGNAHYAVYDEQGKFVPIYYTNMEDHYDSLRVAGDDGSYVYAVENQTGYKVRVLYSNYYEYLHGFQAKFVFGADGEGKDLMVNVCTGLLFSMLLAISVCAINMFIGAIYGAVEGYYGSIVDLAMERFSDIINSMPQIVVITLFQLYLASTVGPIISLLFAFVTFGWIGMAANVRTQFYRFKGREYVLAARTLGASDKRLIFRHIYPNSLGTLITSSALMIPGFIFTESTFTYLGIVNLSGTGLTSLGTILARGQTYLSTFPHIILIPGLIIALLMISFNLFGNGLRDAFNPSLRGAED